ncbi:hypothetical protein OOU_Y34scaffold00669g60 [Pyricularia oryzae Y34]|uniref:Uncharacterized protein n=1 Tax=Pyricularia oryzae (strain Y34) TaxID=1143189 RepID=A0AA97NTI5_PYRO3|nr:hypothetical protein OOU_Y34scaffold00669g60 [Pyricularia oryzae Y34]
MQCHVRGVDGSSQMLGLTWYSPTRDRASRSGRDREGDHLGSPTLSQRIATVSNHRVFGREMGFLRDTASFSSSISSSRVPREVETSTEDPCTMVDKGCEDINVKAEMARQDEASIVHVASSSEKRENQKFNLRSFQYHRVGHPFLVTSTYSVPKFDQRSARTLCNVRGTPLEHASKKGAMMRGPPLQEKREHKPNKVATNIYCTNGLERR